MNQEDNNNLNPDNDTLSDNSLTDENNLQTISNEKIDNDSTINDDFIDDVFKNNYIDLYKLEGLDVKDQSRVFTLVLTDIYKSYDDVDYSSIRKSSLKCLKLSCDPDDNELRLPYKLIVTKDKNRMYFKFEDNTKKNLWLLFIILGIFILTSLGSTYIALRYLSIAHLNLDIDGDGIADLNIDLNMDDKEEINITSNSKTPEVNIDYKGNRKAIFNIDTNGDGKADSNLVNQDTNNDGICDLNCDTNGDGWPDTNIDLDGDGIADMYIDVDGDGNADLNFDTNNDGVCDLHCDTNNDNVCDKNCVKNLEVIEDNTGSSTAIGNNQSNIESAKFIIDFVDSKQITIDGLFPEDQNDDVLKYAYKNIVINNKSSTYVRYKIELVVTEYTFDFEKGNFLYSVTSTNNGFSTGYIKVPNQTTIIADEIAIAPGSTQKYTITFKLRGTNSNQNYDQGKSFSGYFQVYTLE